VTAVGTGTASAAGKTAGTVTYGSGRTQADLGAAAGGLATEPSAAYLDTLDHATRTYAFAPGAAVRIPLRPRAVTGAASGAASSVDDGTASADSASSAGRAAPSAGSASSADSAALPGRGAAPTLSAAGSSSLRRQVYGFLPYWELVDPEMRLDYASLSTIAYFSVAASATGDLVTAGSDGKAASGWAGWHSQGLTDIIDAAHANGVSVDFTLTLFAWTTSQAKVQEAVFSSASARSALVRNLVGAVTDRGADGINLDVEPLVAGQEQNLVSLVRELRTALDAAGPGRRITVDVLGSPRSEEHTSELQSLS